MMSLLVFLVELAAILTLGVVLMRLVLSLLSTACSVWMSMMMSDSTKRRHRNKLR